MCILLAFTFDINKRPADSHAQKAGGHLLTHVPAISFETDSTVECTSKRTPEERGRVKVKLATMALMGRIKKVLAVKCPLCVIIEFIIFHFWNNNGKDRVYSKGCSDWALENESALLIQRERSSLIIHTIECFFYCNLNKLFLSFERQRKENIIFRLFTPVHTSPTVHNLRVLQYKHTCFRKPDHFHIRTMFVGYFSITQ